MSIVSENIKKFRVFRRITQLELGEALGRSKNVVSNWERGDNAPDLDTLAQICRILKVTPNQMFGWEPCKEYEEYRARVRDLEARAHKLNQEKLKIDAELAKIRRAMEDEEETLMPNLYNFIDRSSK